jgi:hypothetical protein
VDDGVIDEGTDDSDMSESDTGNHGMDHGDTPNDNDATGNN